MPATPPPAPRRRLRRLLLPALGLALVGLGVVALALPALVATDFARARILAKVNEQFAPGRVEVDRFVVSWAGPTRLVGFRLLAPDGARVADAPASLECRLHSTVDFGTSTVVFGTVVAASVRQDVLEGDHPTMEGLQPLSRLGRDEWGLPPEVFRITRPGRPEDIPGRG